jgi:hypothetical protein
LFDTYPLGNDEIHGNHIPFFPAAYRKLVSGGILTYYSDEPDQFSQAHIKALLGAGFKAENISGTVVSVEPPENCEYWQYPTILAPKVVKD